MSDDKLKQKHVFVKNNVGSLALHKAKQEIGGIKMDKWKELLNEHKTSDCKECLIEAYRLGALKELKKLYKSISVFHSENSLDLQLIEKHIKELEE